MSTRDDEDFTREIQAHLELEADRLMAEGLDAAEARRAARRAFGNVTTARERFHEASRWMWAEQLAQDLRYGCRTLLRNPAFAATVVFTLAIGLALTTAVFTVFNAYVLRSFAVRDPAGLYQMAWRANDVAGRTFTWREYEAIRDRRDIVAGAIAESTRYVSFEGRPLAAELVSGTYFAMLGPEMSLGRPLDAGDEDTGNAVVLSDQAWAALFARDSAAIGRDITLSGHRFTVVGVLGPRFAGLHTMPRDIWISLRPYAAVAAPDLLAGDARVVGISIRLHPGLTSQQAQTALTPLVATAAGHDQRAWAEVRRQDKPNSLSLRLLTLLSPVFAAFALVLLAGCANVSSVMLARAVARQREMAVRLSLGAGRGRVVRQLLTEGLLIALIAAVAALGLTALGLRIGTIVLFGTLPPSLAAILRMAPLELDHRVFLFALAAGAASTLVFALVPALQVSRVSLSALGAHGGGPRHGSRLRAVLVAGQVAISLLLVVPALTLARNGATLEDVDLGFDITDVLSIHVREGDAVELTRRIATVMGSEPRVAHFAVSNGNPLFGPPRKAILESHGTRVPTPFNFVSPEYFVTLRIPIARGREFRTDEARSEARVAIVSEATARTLWPGQDPIGKTVRIASAIEQPDGEFAGYSEVTVVGIAGDVISGLVVDGPEPGHIYLPTSPGSRHAGSLLARARAPHDLAPEAMYQILRRAVVDPEIFEALPLEEVRRLQVYPFMAASWIGSFLGLVALGLSVSGLFGVLTYTLTQRSREIGIRIALGATAGAVVTMVMRQTAWLAGVGTLAGLGGALALLQLLRTAVRLPGMSLLDGPSFAAGLALITAAAAAAAYQPARRAARVDPAHTLRADN